MRSKGDTVLGMESELHTNKRIIEYNDRRNVMASLLFIDYEFFVVLSVTFWNCGFSKKSWEDEAKIRDIQKKQDKEVDGSNREEERTG